MGQPVKITVLVGNGFDLSAGLEVRADQILKPLVKENYDEEKREFKQTPAGRLAKQIREDGFKAWGDVESKFGEYSKVASQQKDGADEYLDANDVIEEILEEQIIPQEDRIDESFIRANVLECARSLSDWRSLLTRNEAGRISRAYQNYVGDQYNVLCFNYTCVLEKLLFLNDDDLAEISAELDFGWPSIKQFLYVHGRFHDVSDDKPVFGVDNEEQILSEELRQDSDVLDVVVKSENQKMNGTDVSERAMHCIDGANIVMIYGMSLGKTDARWWQQIIKWLQRSEKHFLILFSREAESTKKRSGAYRRFINAKLSQLFEAAGMQDDDISSEVRGRVFIAPSQGFLTITEPLPPSDTDSKQS